jgi:hypothetical protein
MNIHQYVQALEKSDWLDNKFIDYRNQLIQILHKIF